MERSARTQLYLDLAKLSLAIEKNIQDAIELGKSMLDNPNSPFISDALKMTAKMKEVRYDLYSAEADILIKLVHRESNAVELGTLEVLANGQVVAHE